MITELLKAWSQLGLAVGLIVTWAIGLMVFQKALEGLYDAFEWLKAFLGRGKGTSYLEKENSSRKNSKM